MQPQQKKEKCNNDIQEQKQDTFDQQKIISLMRITKKTDPLFRPLKKLKNGLESVGYNKITSKPNKMLLLFHFGLGNELDKQIILKSKITNYLFANKLQYLQNENNSQHLENQKVQMQYQKQQQNNWNPILPGKSYSIIQFPSKQHCEKYLFNQFVPILPEKQQNRNTFTNVIRYALIKHDNLTRILIATFCSDLMKENSQAINIPNCPQNYHKQVSGLHIIQEFINKQEQLQLLKAIDAGKWQRLNNRRVQHFGFEFKYGRNTIDKDQQFENNMPQFIQPVLYRLRQLQIIPKQQSSYDQMTINDYFSGDGIPSHFDTHSPFEEHFIAISMLSNLVMEFRKYNGQQQNVYLKQRSLMVFSGEARYAWTHGIACRKVDKIEGQIRHRARRISITLRKIRRTPCTCPFYFFCDSQGYDQSTMKKNYMNPLLKKYLAQQNCKKLSEMKSQQIYQEYVIKAYNGFGYNFHNKIINHLQNFIESDLKNRSKENLILVLDLGCGNGQYKCLFDQQINIQYIGIQTCQVMEQFSDKIYMNGLNIAFRARNFDIVLCAAVLHHLPTRELRLKMLKQIQKMLSNPESSAYISVFELNAQKKQIYGGENDILLQYCVPEHKIKKIQADSSKSRKQNRGQIYQRYYHLFSEQEIVQLIRQAGMQVIQIKHDEQNIVIKTKKQ